MSKNREYFETLPSGLVVYKVKLVDAAGRVRYSLSSCDVCWHNGVKYVRGPDDRYYNEHAHPNPTNYTDAESTGALTGY
jgi:hypothetical protein